MISHRERSGLAEHDGAFAAFLSAYPAYARTHRLDTLRAREFGRLDAQGHVYLDYTGGALYAASQVREHLDLLRTHILGNPHSANPTSRAATALIEEARSTVLAYFGASPDDYTVIFTANASGALKLVGESYPFAPAGRLLLTADNHNSVLGIREFARARGAATSYAPLTTPDLRVDGDRLQELLSRPSAPSNRLFAYPAQSNFSGVQHPSPGSTRRTPAAGTCCSMAPPSSPPTRWTSAAAARSSSHSPSIRCSVTPPASAA